MDKKAYKFNIIDIILVAFILVAASVLVYIMLGNEIFGGSDETEIIYTLEMTLVRDEHIANIRKIMPGTELIDSVRNHEIGEVLGVDVIDAYVNETDMETGVVRRVPYPGHSTVTIRVKAECKIEDGFKYVINGKPIMVGMPVNFRTPHFVGLARCIYLEEADELKETEINGEE